MTPEEIPVEYRLSFLIGEIVRNDVYLESESWGLWGRLSEAGLIDGERPRDLSRVLEDCRKALRDPSVPNEYRDMVGEVVRLAKATHRLRSVYAHEQWFLHDRWPERIRSMRGTTEQRSAADFAGCARELLRMSWRMRGTWIIAPYWLRLAMPDGWDDLDLHNWTRVAMGHIADVPGRIEGSPGPAPMPPWRAEERTS